MLDLPVEDLADALETLSGEEQQAVFSALDSEKAAEVLMEAEPRAQRQLIATLRREKARQILSEMSIPQLADLFSALPHEHVVSMMSLLPEQDAGRIQAIISDRESVARVLMSTEFLAVPKDTKVGQVLAEIRSGRHPHDSISYVYVVAADAVLVGVVDLRDLVLAPDDAAVGDLMVFPVVMAQEDDVREDVAEMFAKYHFRMIPVVNKEDRLLGVIHYKDVMKGLVTRART
jgi:magnesium transporter